MPTAIDAPDSLWQSAAAAVDAPDSLWQAVLLAQGCPDRIVTAPLVVVDAPDRVVVAALALADADDSIITGLVPSAVWAGLRPGGITYGLDSSGTGRQAYPRATAKLLRNGSAVDWTDLTLEWGVKRGWSWSATVPGDTLDLYDALTSNWQIVINDGLGFTLESPPLVALPRETTEQRSETPPSGSISGVDRTTWKCGLRNVSPPTFKNTTSRAVLTYLANLQQLQLSGYKVFPVPDEDVKQSLLADAIDRFRGVGAQETMVDEVGRILFFGWHQTAGALEVDWSTVRHTVDLTKRFTKMKIGKRSARQGNHLQGDFDFPFTDVGPKSFPLPTPLYNPQAYDRSTVGFVDLVAFWDGDPTRQATLIGMSVWNQGVGLNLPQPTPNGKPATHITCYCFNPGGTVQIVLPGLDPSKVVCLLHVHGTPAGVQEQQQGTDPEGTDPEFLYAYDSGITPAWPADDVIDSLFPSKQWVITNAPDYLNLKNKGWDKLSINAVCHANVKLRQTLPYKGNTFKVDDIRWHFGSGAPTVDLELVRV